MPNRKLLWAIGGGLGVAALVGSLALLFFQPRWLFRLVQQVAPGAVFFQPWPTDSLQQPIALTIDDGPDPTTTPKILAVLAEHEAQATFFVIGERAAAHPELIDAMVEQGHELGNHLMRDEPSIQQSLEAFEQDLLAAEAILRDGLARSANSAGSATSPGWLRPAGGFYSQERVAIAARHGYRTVLGSIFPYDTHIPWSTFAQGQILANLRPGEIIVLHDSYRDGQSGYWGQRTAQTLAAVIPKIQQRGYTLVTLSELIP